MGALKMKKASQTLSNPIVNTQMNNVIEEEKDSEI